MSLISPPSLRIYTDQWLQIPVVKRIFDVLGAYHMDARFVGGCVRDALMGISSPNLDLAVAAPYEQFEKILNEKGFNLARCSPQHQSLMVYDSSHQIDLTSLRQDQDCDGRHAQTIFITDWLQDAKRRDLTINALYSDTKGNVFDPLDGYHDIQNKMIRFIGNAHDRIQEDALRILRFFRFFSQLDGFQIHQNEVEACSHLASNMGGLSKERITKEFFLLLSGPQVDQALEKMAESSLLEYVFSQHHLDFWFDFRKRVGKQWGKINPLDRLFVLTQAMPITTHSLALTRQDIRRLNKYENWISLSQKSDFQSFLKKIRHQEDDNTFQLLAHMVALLHRYDNDQIIDQLFTLKWPSFPLNGTDLLNDGYPKGPVIKEILQKTYDFWIIQQAPMTKQQCLEWVHKNFSLASSDCLGH